MEDNSHTNPIPRDPVLERSPSEQIGAATREERAEFLWNVQKYINDYLRFGDTKAGFAVATASAILGALLRVRAQTAFMCMPHQWAPAGWFAALAFLFLCLSILVGVVAVTPPLRQSRTPGLMYWTEIASHRDESNFWASVASHSADELTRTLAKHVFIVSVICRVKYRLVTACILFGVLGAVFAALFASVHLYG
jgi:hypothetical protein